MVPDVDATELAFGRGVGALWHVHTGTSLIHKNALSDHEKMRRKLECLTP